MEEIKEKLRRIGSRLKPILEKDSGYEFKWYEREKPTSLVSLTRVFNEEDLPTVFQGMDLFDYYKHKEIDWTKYFFDKDLYSLDRSIYVDEVRINPTNISIIIHSEFFWAFMLGKYYGCWLIEAPGVLRSRENRMKATRFIPGVIKDIEMFLNCYIKL
ncbi:MAG: hypothetical protein ACP5LN_10645 [Thermoproteota archaeon]